MSSSDAGNRRGLRDRPLGRVLILVALLVVAAVVSRSCAGSDPTLSKDDAIAAARKVLVFEADSVQVRFVRQGLPPRPYWYVSFYDGKPIAPTRQQLVKVDAETGAIVDDGLRN